jgi:glucokinase
VRAPVQIIERNGTLLGRAVASAAALVDCRRVVVGGSVALGWGEPFFEAANRELRSRSRLVFTAGLDIVPAGLGRDAPLMGAARLALRHLTGERRGSSFGT